MPPSSALPYLTDLIEAIEHIREKAGTTPLDVFKQDWEQQWIVQRGIEIVSEASGRLPDRMKDRYPGIPWPKIAAVGNILRHEYRQVSPPLLWEIVQDHLALLDEACRAERAENRPPVRAGNRSGKAIAVFVRVRRWLLAMLAIGFCA